MATEKDHAFFAAHATALRALTDHTLQHHSESPKETLHRPADHESSNLFLTKYFPQAHTSFLSQYRDNWETTHHLGNYVIDRRTNAKTFEPMSIYVRLGMHLLYYGSAQSKMLHLAEVKKLLEEQTVKMGREYDNPESKAHIQPFIESFDLGGSLVELKEPDPSKYPTFNHFFARELRDGARPVQDLSLPGLVCSPADCRLTAFRTIDMATKYWIKGHGFSLANLLGSEDMAERFDGGSMVIARLAPQDYHRWHSPIDGTIIAVKEIPGAYYTVNPQAINEATTLNVFCENRRSVMGLKRKETGSPVVIIAVGAMLVGSIKYNDGVEEGREVERGQCLGAFYYGGSTVIVVYPKDEIVLDEDLVRNSTELGCETQMMVGWRVGTSKA